MSFAPASAENAVSKAYHSLTLIAGLEATKDYLQRPVDLNVRGGGIFQKNLVVCGNVDVGDFINGNLDGNIFTNSIMASNSMQGINVVGNLIIDDDFTLTANTISANTITNNNGDDIVIQATDMIILNSPDIVATGNLVPSEGNTFCLGTMDRSWGKLYTHDLIATGNIMANIMNMNMMGNIAMADIFCANIEVQTDRIVSKSTGAGGTVEIDGDLTMNGGNVTNVTNISGTSGGTGDLNVCGNVTLKNGDVTVQDGDLIVNEGNLNMTDGSITNVTNIVPSPTGTGNVQVCGTLEVKQGGDLVVNEGDVIIQDGDVNLTGGNVTNVTNVMPVSGGNVQVCGSLEIKDGGDLVVNEGDVIVQEGDLNLTGGNVTNVTNVMPVSGGNVQVCGSLEIKDGGDLIVNEGDVIVQQGDVNLTGGNVTNVTFIGGPNGGPITIGGPPGTGITVNGGDITNVSSITGNATTGNVEICANLELKAGTTINMNGGNITNVTNISTTESGGNVTVNGDIDMMCGNIFNIGNLHVDNVFGKNSPVNFQNTINIANTTDGGNITFEGGIEIGSSTTVAPNTNSVAVGKGAIAGGTNQICIGPTARTLQSSGRIAIGSDATAISAGGANQIAIGTSTRTYGDNSITIGPANYTESQRAITIGVVISNFTSHENVAIGYDADSSLSYRSVVVGAKASSVLAPRAVAIGENADANAGNVVCIGSNPTGSLERAIAIGKNATASLDGISMGYNTSTGTRGIAIGSRAIGSATNSVAIGGGYASAQGAEALGQSSLSIMRSSSVEQAGSIGAIAIGYYCTVTGTSPGAVAIGGHTLAGSIAGATAGASGAISIGTDSVASGPASIAIGGANSFIAPNPCGAQSTALGAISMGMQSRSAGTYSIAIGAGLGAIDDDGAVATATHAIAIGHNSLAGHTDSIALGPNASTTGTDRAFALNVNTASVITTGTPHLRCTVNGTPREIPLTITGIGGGVGTGNLIIANVLCANTRVEADLIIPKTPSGNVVVGGNLVVDTLYATTIGGNSPVDFIDEINITSAGSRITFEDGVEIGNATTTTFDSRGISIGKGSSVSATAGVALGNESTVSGAGSIAIGGSTALEDSAKTFGAYAVAIGSNSLSHVVSVALGSGSRALNSDSVAVGHDAISSMNSTALGAYAQATSSSGIAIGKDATSSNVIAMAIGVNSTSSGNQSMALGFNAIGDGLNSVSIGTDAKTYGEKCISIGAEAGPQNSSGTGADNIAIGGGSLQGINNPAAIRNIGIGTYAGESITSGKDNVMIGNCAGDYLTTGVYQVAIGSYAGAGVTTGSYNIAIGKDAIGKENTTTGDENIGIGVGALNGLTTGIKNIGIGTNAFSVGPGPGAADGGICIGWHATGPSGASKNIAIGYDSQFQGGTDCIVIGTTAGNAISPSGKNIAIGTSSLVNHTGATGRNVSIGSNSGTTIGSGGNNVILGTYANTNGAAVGNSVVIGDGATGADSTVVIGKSASVTVPNGVAIGNGAAATTTTRSLALNIHDDSVITSNPPHIQCTVNGDDYEIPLTITGLGGGGGGGNSAVFRIDQSGTSQSIPNGSVGANVNMSVEDTNNMSAPGTWSGNVFTMSQTGWFHINAGVDFEPLDQTGTIQLLINNDDSRCIGHTQLYSTPGNALMSLDCTEYFTAGDELAVRVKQNTVSAKSVYNSHFVIHALTGVSSTVIQANSIVGNVVTDEVCANVKVITDKIEPKGPEGNVCVNGNLIVDTLYATVIAGNSPITIVDDLDFESIAPFDNELATTYGVFDSNLFDPDQWQSVTALSTGTLDKVRLDIYGGGAPATIQLYAGEGIGGTLLATATNITVPTFAQTNPEIPISAFTLSGVWPGGQPQGILNSGSFYTLRVSSAANFIWGATANGNTPAGTPPTGHFDAGMGNRRFHFSLIDITDTQTFHCINNVKAISANVLSGIDDNVLTVESELCVEANLMVDTILGLQNGPVNIIDPVFQGDVQFTDDTGTVITPNVGDMLVYTDNGTWEPKSRVSYTKNIGYLTTLTSGISLSTTVPFTLNVNDTTGFPASGTLSVSVPGSNLSIVTYTGKTATTFTGCLANNTNFHGSGIRVLTAFPVTQSSNEEQEIIFDDYTSPNFDDYIFILPDTSTLDLGWKIKIIVRDPGGSDFRRQSINFVTHTFNELTSAQFDVGDFGCVRCTSNGGLNDFTEWSYELPFGNAIE
jgi:hypothetical protein